MTDGVKNISPRIGVYYGIVVDQDHLPTKVQPVEIALTVEKVVGISPFDPHAVWKLDYDHSQCFRTIVVYHAQYSKISPCPGFVGGWVASGNTKIIPIEISEEAEIISRSIERLLYPHIETDDTYGIIGIGYSVIYLVG